MPDFVDWRIPLWLRRLITMAPTVIVAACCDATQALAVSQVVLSFVLPVPLITLVLFTGSPRVMGRLANSPVVSALAITGTVVVLSINALLLVNLILPG
jgi:manganese transport protein